MGFYWLLYKSTVSFRDCSFFTLVTEMRHIIMIRRVYCLSVIIDFTFVALLSGSSMAGIIAHTVGAQIR